MRVILFRHGIAVDRDDPACPTDPERPLTLRGAERTRVAAQGLASLAPEVEAVWTSPYLRAKQTAALVAHAVGNVPITEHGVLAPDRDPKELLTLLAEGAHDSVLCVGHAPHLDQVIARALIPAGPRRLLTQLRKAGAACLEFHPWPHSAALLGWVVTARALRALAR